MKFSIITFLVLVLTFNGQAQVNTQLLENLMKQRPEMFGEIINHPNEYRLQLFYTQIDRDQYNIPHFKEYSYRLNPSEYFYPASTVKMPLAIMALDKINNLLETLKENIIPEDDWSVFLVYKISNNEYLIKIQNKEHQLQILSINSNGMEFVLDNKFHNLTLTINRSSMMYLYVDGVSVGTPVDVSSTSSIDLNNSDKFYIGSYGSSDGQSPLYFFKGNIGQAFIYNRALTAQEVTTNFNVFKTRFGL